MAQSLISKVLLYQNQAIKHKEKLEAKKLHKLLMIIWPPHQKEYYICLAVIETCNNLLDYSK